MGVIIALDLKIFKYMILLKIVGLRYQQQIMYYVAMVQ